MSDASATTATTAPNYLISQLDDLPAVRCPCGWTKRAFAVPGNDVATIHLVDIQQDARTHYHKRLTEIYLVISGTGHLEIDGVLVPVKPLTAILIKPGARHRAIGKLTIVNIPIPAFDPHDEWFD
jgi:mannose-6-phosphate isomerase-like protein (cupin superfamily)